MQSLINRVRSCTSRIIRIVIAVVVCFRCIPSLSDTIVLTLLLSSTCTFVSLLLLPTCCFERLPFDSHSSGDDG